MLLCTLLYNFGKGFCLEGYVVSNGFMGVLSIFVLEVTDELSFLMSNFEN